MKHGYFKKALSAIYLVFIVTGSLLCAGWWPQKKYERTGQISAPVPHVDEILVNTGSGNITITGAQTSDCNVTAKIIARALKADEARRLAEQTLVKLELQGNALVVTLLKPQAKFAAGIVIDYNIIVPAESNITCETSRGHIKLSNIKGNVTAVAKLGDIAAENITGRIQLNTSYGDVSCYQAVSPYFAAKSRFGDIGVVFSESSPKNLAARLTTSYGDIKADIPESFVGDIACKTALGKIKTEVPVLIKGEISKKKLIGKIGLSASPALRVISEPAAEVKTPAPNDVNTPAPPDKTAKPSPNDINTPAAIKTAVPAPNNVNAPAPPKAKTVEPAPNDVNDTVSKVEGPAACGASSAAIKNEGWVEIETKFGSVTLK